MAEGDEWKASLVFDASEEEDEDELLRELLLVSHGPTSPFPLAPRELAGPSQLQPEENRWDFPGDGESAAANKQLLISAVYSGPTIVDIESALSSSFIRKGVCDRATLRSGSRPTISLQEKGYGSGIEKKYTLKIKSCANGMADDGYKWRKYGQKTIKNSPHPRSYYKCTNPRCNAKKQVERSPEDPDVLVVTYEGLHLHYAYSHFFLPQDFSTAASPKRQRSTDHQVPPASSFQPGKVAVKDIPQGSAGDRSNLDWPCPQGLLEDIVPLLVRNPSTDVKVFLDENLSQPSSPISSSSSSCLSWSPMTYFDVAVGVLSSSTL